MGLGHFKGYVIYAYLKIILHIILNLLYYYYLCFNGFLSSNTELLSVAMRDFYFGDPRVLLTDLKNTS